MPDRIFIDSSFILALVNHDDQHYWQAKRLANSPHIKGQYMLTTDAVLLEVGNALSRNNRKDAVRTIEDALLSPEVEVIHLTPDLFQRAFDLYTARADKTWGLVDCVSFVVMREAGVTQALTADRHFGQAGFQVLLRDTTRT